MPRARDPTTAVARMSRRWPAMTVAEEKQLVGAPDDDVMRKRIDRAQAALDEFNAAHPMFYLTHDVRAERELRADADMRAEFPPDAVDRMHALPPVQIVALKGAGNDDALAKLCATLPADEAERVRAERDSAVFTSYRPWPADSTAEERALMRRIVAAYNEAIKKRGLECTKEIERRNQLEHKVRLARNAVTRTAELGALRDAAPSTVPSTLFDVVRRWLSSVRAARAAKPAALDGARGKAHAWAGVRVPVCVHPERPDDADAWRTLRIEPDGPVAADDDGYAGVDAFLLSDHEGNAMGTLMASTASLHAARAGPTAAACALTALVDFARDPLAALCRGGRALGACIVCNRPLSDEESKRRGIGPVCATMFEGGARDVLAMARAEAPKSQSSKQKQKKEPKKKATPPPKRKRPTGAAGKKEVREKKRR